MPQDGNGGACEGAVSRAPTPGGMLCARLWWSLPCAAGPPGPLLAILGEGRARAALRPHSKAPSARRVFPVTKINVRAAVCRAQRTGGPLIQPHNSPPNTPFLRGRAWGLELSQGGGSHAGQMSRGSGDLEQRLPPFLPSPQP